MHVNKSSSVAGSLRVMTICLLSMLFPSLEAQAEFDSGRAAFSLSVNNEIYPYTLFSTFVVPEEQLVLGMIDSPGTVFEVSSADGKLKKVSDIRYTWTAPAKTGRTTVQIRRQGDGETIHLNVFVMVPATKLKNGYLNGKLIGDYPGQLNEDPLYLPPDGFIRVGREDQHVRISPHFMLGQFITSTDRKFPKYIVVRERLLLKLEALLERLHERGFDPESFSVLAAYMTPAYNSAAGGDMNNRYIYGGAAAVMLDRDRDKIMDDLDGNGIYDDADGQVLFDLIDELYQQADKSYLRGGLFLYSRSERLGPYVMLDARGYRKRWQASESLARLPEEMGPKTATDSGTTAKQ